MTKTPILAVILLAAACCARPDNNPYPTHDLQGRPVEPDPGSCMASMAARRYLYEMREVLVSSWQPPPGELGPLSFVLFFRIDESGGLTQVHSETPDDPIHASAIAAFQEAAPFGTVPAEARCLTEEPFEMHFTIGSP